MKTPKRGRPSTRKAERLPAITSEQIEIIGDALSKGAFIETAVAIAGVAKSSFYDWLKRGSVETSGPRRALLDVVKKGIATAECKYVEVIGAAASSQWAAAAWILERRWPEKFARRAITPGHHPTDRQPEDRKRVA